MFKNPFSFNGRIRRTEFILSLFIPYLIGFIFSDRLKGHNLWFLYILAVPFLWFVIAQGAKRCHDMGNSAWCQIVPIFILWMIGSKGEIGTNQYGTDPRVLSKQQTIIANILARIIAAALGISIIALGIWLIYDNALGTVESKNEYGVRVGVVPLPKETSDAVFNAGEIVLFMLPFIIGFAFLYSAFRRK